MSEVHAPRVHSINANLLWFALMLFAATLIVSAVSQFLPLVMAAQVQYGLGIVGFAAAIWLAVARFAERRPGELGRHRTLLALSYGAVGALLNIVIGVVVVASVLLAPSDPSTSPEQSHWVFGFALQSMSRAVSTIVFGSALAWVMITLIKRQEQ